MEDNKLDYIVAKIEKIAEDIVIIKVLDAKQNEQLAEHMRRSALLEKRVEQVDREIRPLKSQFDSIRGIIKFIGTSAVAIGIVEALRRLVL